MSHVNFEVTNEAVTPQVESSFFLEKPEARFAVGVLAVGSRVVLGRESEYDAYFKLRRAVYVEQTGQLSIRDLNPDGTDRDEDDCRSIAFGVVENRGLDKRLVATVRLIQKDLGKIKDMDALRPLPIELEWPELFVNKPAKPTSIEVSRLISRHENASIQELNKRKLYSVLLAYAQAKNLGPPYAIVEEWFAKYLNLNRFPFKRLSEPKYVEHYRDVNIPIEIDTLCLAERIETANPGTLAEMRSRIGEIAFYGALHNKVDAD